MTSENRFKANKGRFHEHAHSDDGYASHYGVGDGMRKPNHNLFAPKGYETPTREEVQKIAEIYALDPTSLDELDIYRMLVDYVKHYPNGKLLRKEE